MAAKSKTVTEFHVNEIACDKAGPLSPFGTDVELPVAVEHVWYQHPGPQDRPNLAGRP
jgi:hypothetical protein